MRAAWLALRSSSGATRSLAIALISALYAAVSVDVAGAPLEDVIQQVKPGVVAVGTYLRTRNPQFQFLGTGFAVGDGNTIATNGHVLPATLDDEKRESIAVVVINGEAYDRRDAQTLRVDREHDLALLRISGPPLHPLRLASAEPREGQATAFTGFPIGAVLGLVPVTHRATVSALTPIAMPAAAARQLDARLMRRLDAGAFRVLQLDATAYPGNSGSPLYDASTGEVLGIINMVFVKATKETILSQPSGITFAVPARYLRELLTP